MGTQLKFSFLDEVSAKSWQLITTISSVALADVLHSK
jgi:hypothetical protein